MAAAAFAANRGVSTAIVGSLGETWFTSGLMDLMGVHPVDSGRTWSDPWSAIDAVRRDMPAHPYARLPNESIQAAMSEFFDVLSAAGLPYCYDAIEHRSNHGVSVPLRRPMASL
jgi:glycerol-3-phosphate dehydrogenase subunit B